MIVKLLKIFTQRAVVLNSTDPLMIRYLKADLKEKGFDQMDKITDAIAAIIVKEAYQRAAAFEKDNFARSGELVKQIEIAADSIIASFRGDEDTDHRIKSILIFNHIL